EGTWKRIVGPWPTADNCEVTEEIPGALQTSESVSRHRFGRYHGRQEALLVSGNPRRAQWLAGGGPSREAHRLAMQRYSLPIAQRSSGNRRNRPRPCCRAKFEAEARDQASRSFAV